MAQSLRSPQVHLFLHRSLIDGWCGVVVSLGEQETPPSALRFVRGLSPEGLTSVDVTKRARYSEMGPKKLAATDM